MTYTILIREVVTTDHRVTIQADTRADALVEATRRAAIPRRFRSGRKVALTISTFPLPKTLEPQA